MSNHIIVTGPAFVSANLLCRVLQTSPSVYFVNPKDRFSELFQREKFIRNKMTVDSSVNWGPESSLGLLYAKNKESIRSNHTITVDEVLNFERHFPPNQQQIYFLHARTIFDNDNIVELLRDNRFLINVYLNPMHELSLQAIKLFMDRCFFHVSDGVDWSNEIESINSWVDNDYYETICNMMFHMVMFNWPHNYGLSPRALPILEKYDKIINVPMMDILDVDKVMLLSQRLNLKLDYSVVKQIIKTYISLNQYTKYPLFYPDLQIFKRYDQFQKQRINELPALVKEEDYNEIIEKLIKNKEIQIDLISQNIGIGEIYNDFTNIYELFFEAVKLAEKFDYNNLIKKTDKKLISILKTHKSYRFFEKIVKELILKNSKILKNLPKLAVFKPF
tara:strand:+ start:4828 stop:5997 length:1170 start_codon:yes stop_codon:yes gene_type:complete